LLNLYIEPIMSGLIVKYWRVIYTSVFAQFLRRRNCAQRCLVHDDWSSLKWVWYWVCNNCI